ncbi:MAG TPA: ABC transporter permease [Vicinamibacterales bacterium]|nr:ABC transporter permease [Vicinamibacterales bacterium]
MFSSLAELREFLRIATEALGRYKLRTSLSVLGVVLGVAAVIAMMSVSEGARREALAQVEALGLDNLVARSNGSSTLPASWHGLVAGDSAKVQSFVPFVRASSPLINRSIKVSRADRWQVARVLGVRPAFANILGLSMDRGRFLSAVDELTIAPVCVLGSAIARELFAYRNPMGERIRLDQSYYEVVGVLREQGTERRAGAALAWHDANQAVFVPFSTLSGRTLAITPDQPADEIWVQIGNSTRSEDLARILEQTLVRLHHDHEFTVVVPRELLAQRYRTQHTFSIVVGSVALLALIVGGIGIMNIMLTSVVERTQEIGVRRTVGATRRDVTIQFLVETLLMTVGGGVAGIVIGALTAMGITTFAGWNTHVSILAVAVGFSLSFIVGVAFGLYPAMKAAALQPIDALRYE